MIYWFTGQPGHGKTLHAIDKALSWVDEGRLVYACNVRGLKHQEAGFLPMTPEEFRTWPDTLPDGAACLVDEAYEHGMLPKRGPGTKVPHHVEQLAKHRHRGLDFIFVSQSPAKQVDDFVHDLIEQHVHVRRRFGLMFAHLRIFDRMERNPASAHPLILKRVRLPKRPMGLYESTKQDTTEKRVPWYYPAAAALLLGIVVFSFITAKGVRDTFANGMKPPGSEATKDGAPATAGGANPPGVMKTTRSEKYADATDYLTQHQPRVAGMPWSAPIYDGQGVVSKPQLLCALGGPGLDANGVHQEESCTCLTEQGTPYVMPFYTCRTIAQGGGAYNPYKAPERSDSQRNRGAGGTPADKGQRPAVALPAEGIGEASELQAAYGGMRPQG